MTSGVNHCYVYQWVHPYHCFLFCGRVKWNGFWVHVDCLLKLAVWVTQVPYWWEGTNKVKLSNPQNILLRLKLYQKGPKDQEKNPTYNTKEKKSEWAPTVINFTLEAVSLTAPSNGRFLAHLIHRLDAEARTKCMQQHEKTDNWDSRPCLSCWSNGKEIIISFLISERQLRHITSMVWKKVLRCCSKGSCFLERKPCIMECF